MKEVGGHPLCANNKNQQNELWTYHYLWLKMTFLNCIVNNIAIGWKHKLTFFSYMSLIILDKMFFFQILKKGFTYVKLTIIFLKVQKTDENCGYLISNELLDFNTISITPSKIHENGFLKIL